jgi:ferritin
VENKTKNLNEEKDNESSLSIYFVSTIYMQNMQPKYYCKNCDYSCSRKFLWNQHTITKKHNANKMVNNANKNMQKPILCDCGKSYKHQSSYSRHIKVCLYMNEERGEIKTEEIVLISQENTSVQELLKGILQENRALRDEIKNIKVTTNNNININVFLNEHCKNAMNLTDFVNNINLTIEDLEYSGRHGYVEGVSQILIKNLTDIDPLERPLHCCDTKRLKFYVKDNNGWDRDPNNEKLDKSIDNIGLKQHAILKEWEKNNPNYEKNKEKLDEYFSIVRSLMGGGDHNEVIQNKNKIIKNVSNDLKIKDVFDNSIKT